ncbi:hypothetical protein OC844_004910 [Tilletia horrida]|nr:hypothetical protein OC844_004910 [Tilletia horrida]
MAERGRESIITTTGRGGAGNMIRSPSRGRPQGELPPASAIAAAHNPAVGNLVHAGRGGAGNVRSPSRDPLERQRVREAEQQEQKLQADYAKNEASHYHATGRGGAGNIQSTDAPRGRDASVDAAASTTTAGGAVGNILRSLSRSRSRSREPRPVDRRRPSQDGSAGERSVSRTRGGAGAGAGGEGGLPSVSENGGGTVGITAEEAEAATAGSNGAGVAPSGGNAQAPTSFKDKILEKLQGNK